MTIGAKPAQPLDLITPTAGDVWTLEGGNTWNIRWTGGTGKAVRLLYKVKDHAYVTDPSRTYTRKTGSGDQGWRQVPGAESINNAALGGTFTWSSNKPDGNGVRNNSTYATPFSNQVVMRVEEIEGSTLGVSSMYDESGNYTMTAPAPNFRINSVTVGKGGTVQVAVTVSNAATGPTGYWDVTRCHDLRMYWDSSKLTLTGQSVSNSTYFNYYRDTPSSIIVETPIGKSETSTIPNGLVITLTFKAASTSGAAAITFDTSMIGMFRPYNASGSSYTTQQLSNVTYTNGTVVVS
jgi:hypothetical protein